MEKNGEITECFFNKSHMIIADSRMDVKQILRRVIPRLSLAVIWRGCWADFREDPTFEEGSFQKIHTCPPVDALARQRTCSASRSAKAGRKPLSATYLRWKSLKACLSRMPFGFFHHFLTTKDPRVLIVASASFIILSQSCWTVGMS